MVKERENDPRCDLCFLLSSGTLLVVIHIAPVQLAMRLRHNRVDRLRDEVAHALVHAVLLEARVRLRLHRLAVRHVGDLDAHRLVRALCLLKDVDAELEPAEGVLLRRERARARELCVNGWVR